MPSPADVEATKMARRMFGKRGFDVSGCDIRVSHGICTIRGVLRLIPGTASGGEEDVEKLVLHIAGLLRRRPEIRDVSLDVDYH